MVILAGCSENIQNDEVVNVLERNSINMVLVKGGTFTIGDSGDGSGENYLTNISEVQATNELILDDFLINKYEVTWFEYEVYLKDVGLYGPDEPSSIYFGIKSDDNESSPNYKFRPAMSESWGGANSYCKWLALKTGENYALPTEAQWEYAARSRGKKVFHAGKPGVKLVLDNYMRGEYVVKNRETNEVKVLNASDPLAPVIGNALGEFETNYRRIVGSYPPNELGLYDMVGNVQEWVADWYEKEYYPKMERVNPLGPREPVEWAKFRNGKSIPKKVVRDWLYGGGLIQNGEVYTRGSKPINNSQTGFRCVKNISSET